MFFYIVSVFTFCAEMQDFFKKKIQVSKVAQVGSSTTQPSQNKHTEVSQPPAFKRIVISKQSKVSSVLRRKETKARLF